MTATLKTLRAALHVAGLQAEELRAMDPEWEAMEMVSLELQQLSERVEDEMKALGTFKPLGEEGA